MLLSFSLLGLSLTVPGSVTLKALISLSQTRRHNFR